MQDHFDFWSTPFWGQVKDFAPAGLIGALLRALTSPKDNVIGTIKWVIIGLISSIYLGEIVAGFMVTQLGVSETRAAGPAGFLTGYAGIRFVDLILAIVKSKISSRK